MKEPQNQQEYEQHFIDHMVRIVGINLRKKTGKMITIEPPRNAQELAKLKMLYDQIMDKYGKTDKS